MDLNYLYFRYQLSLMRAAAASCVEARIAHRGLANLYAAEIAAARGKQPLRETRPFMLADRADDGLQGSIADVARA